MSLPYTIPEDVVSESLEEETVILNLTTGIYFRLDPVGTSIWNHLKKYGDLEKTRELMLAEFDVPAEQLAADLSRLIDELMAKGLLAEGK